VVVHQDSQWLPLNRFQRIRITVIFYSPPFSARLAPYRHYLYQIINIFLAMIKRDAYIRGLLQLGNGLVAIHAASPKFCKQEYFARFSKGALANAVTVMSGLAPFFSCIRMERNKGAAYPEAKMGGGTL
jgi:hypothetical protein